MFGLWLFSKSGYDREIGSPNKAEKLKKKTSIAINNIRSERAK